MAEEVGCRVKYRLGLIGVIAKGGGEDGECGYEVGGYGGLDGCECGLQ